MSLKATIQVPCDEPKGLVCEPASVPAGVYNYGNPVFTMDSHINVVLPQTERAQEDCVAGYNCNPINVLYKTTSSDYGSQPPTFNTIAPVFFSKSQKFSSLYGKCGMPRNRGLNVASDKSRLAKEWMSKLQNFVRFHCLTIYRLCQVFMPTKQQLYSLMCNDWLRACHI